MDSMRYLPPDLREILGDDSDLDNVSPKKVTQNSYFNGAHSKGILSTPTRNIISLTPPELTIPSSVDFGFRSTINNANTVSPQPSKLFATRPPRFPPGLVPKNAFLFSNETDDQTDADLCHLTSRVERKLTFSDQGSVSSDTCSIFAPFKNEKEAVLRPRAHSSPVCDNPAVKQSGKGKKKKRTKPNTNKRSSSSSSSSLTASKQPEEDKKKTLYKTEICRSYEETGKCKFDDRCLFAHGKEELREVKRHPRYKTEICRVSFTLCPNNFSLFGKMVIVNTEEDVVSCTWKKPMKYLKGMF